jgi:hypothetical protein
MRISLKRLPDGRYHWSGLFFVERQGSGWCVTNAAGERLATHPGLATCRWWISDLIMEGVSE